MTKEAKGRKILMAAKKLFEKRGFKKVSISEIVKKANIAKGTFYLYFKNKEDVYIQILEKYRIFGNTCMKHALEHEKDLYKRLYHNFVGGLVFFRENVILKEIVLENKDYYSECVNKEVFMDVNTAMIKTLIGNDINKIRKELTIEDIAKIDTFFVMLLRYENYHEEEFWRLTDRLAKCIIDGMLSEKKWNDEISPKDVMNCHKEKNIIF